MDSLLLTHNISWSAALDFCPALVPNSGIVTGFFILHFVTVLLGVVGNVIVLTFSRLQKGPRCPSKLLCVSLVFISLISVVINGSAFMWDIFKGGNGLIGHKNVCHALAFSRLTLDLFVFFVLFVALLERLSAVSQPHVHKWTYCNSASIILAWVFSVALVISASFEGTLGYVRSVGNCYIDLLNTRSASSLTLLVIFGALVFLNVIADGALFYYLRKLKLIKDRPIDRQINRISRQRLQKNLSVASLKRAASVSTIAAVCVVCATIPMILSLAWNRSKKFDVASFEGSGIETPVAVNVSRETLCPQFLEFVPDQSEKAIHFFLMWIMIVPAALIVPYVQGIRGNVFRDLKAVITRRPPDRRREE